MRRLNGSDVVVVDCLTLWLSNALLAGLDLRPLAAELQGVVATNPARLFLVSNEVGWGVVPDNPLGRRFRDEAGLLHHRLAESADEVRLVVAGQALELKA